MYFHLYRRRNVQSSSNSKQSIKQPMNSLGGTENESIAKKAQQASVKALPNKHPADIHLGPSSTKPSATTKSVPTSQPAASTTGIKPAPIAASATTAPKPKPADPANTDDSRKMLADLPVLLQDLGTSKLLQKFKQQQAEAEAATSNSAAVDGPEAPVASASDTAGTVEEKKELDTRKPSTFEESGIYDGEGNEKTALNSSTSKSPIKHLDTSVLANNDNVLNQSISSRKSSRASQKSKERYFSFCL